MGLCVYVFSLRPLRVLHLLSSSSSAMLIMSNVTLDMHNHVVATRRCNTPVTSCYLYVSRLPRLRLRNSIWRFLQRWVCALKGKSSTCLICAWRNFNSSPLHAEHSGMQLVSWAHSFANERDELIAYFLQMLTVLIKRYRKVLRFTTSSDMCWILKLKN